MDGFARKGHSAGRLSVERLEDRFLLAGGLLPARPLLPPPPAPAAHVSSAIPYTARSEGARADPDVVSLWPAPAGLPKVYAAPAQDRATAGPLPADARTPDPDRDGDGDRGAEYRDRPEHDSSPNWVILAGSQALNGASGGTAGTAGTLPVPSVPAALTLPVVLGAREPPTQGPARPVDMAVAPAPVPTAEPAAPVAGAVPADACSPQSGAAALAEPPALEEAPPAGAPLAGALPFDLEALERGVDRFFAQLADLREEWDGLWSPSRLWPWLTASAAAALVIARRRGAPAEPTAAHLLPRGAP